MVSHPRAASCAAVVLTLVLSMVGAACSADGQPTGPWRPVAAEVLIAAPDQLYDVSPDGAWVAHQADDQFCLTPTADGEPVCATKVETGIPQGAWSPAGDRAAVLGSFAEALRPGPVSAIDIDGTVTTLVDPGDELGRIPSFVAFADDGTLIYTTFSPDDPELQIRRVGVDGSGDELVASFDGESPMVGVDGGRWSFDQRWVLDGDSVVTMVFPNRNSTIARLGFDGSVDAVAIDDAMPGSLWIPVDAAHGVIVVGEGSALAGFGASEGSGFVVLDEAGDIRPIPTRPDLQARSAVFSPSGDSVAMVWSSESDPDTTVLAIATVDSIIAGAPDWQDLAEPLDGFSQDLDGFSTPLVWTEPDTIMFEGDPLVRITLEPIG